MARRARPTSASGPGRPCPFHFLAQARRPAAFLAQDDRHLLLRRYAMLVRPSRPPLPPAPPRRPRPVPVAPEPEPVPWPALAAGGASLLALLAAVGLAFWALAAPAREDAGEPPVSLASSVAPSRPEDV